MFSLDLESQILALARAKGLLADAHPDAAGPAPGGAPGPWGPRLDSLLSAGVLTVDSVKELAWEAIRASPQGSFLDAMSLHDPGPAQAGEPLPAPGARYSDFSLLGEGATAKVYKAFDATLRRWVALKYLKAGRNDHQSAVLMEARAQAQVEHPNICRIYEVGEDHGRPFIAMQLVEGSTLSAACGAMPVATRLQVVRDLAEGIHRAHRKGLVHLDLKLGNVLMEVLDDGSWQPFLTDFGMVRAEQELSGRSCPMGTPPYSSPEQLSGDSARVDRRSDLYSLGVMLYVLLSQSFPFEADSFQGLLDAIREHRVVPLGRRVRDLPEDLAAIVGKCLELDPVARYDSAQALADDLQRFLDGEPVLARQYKLRHHIATWLKRRRLELIAAGTGFAVLAVAGWLWQSARRTSRATAERILQAQEAQRQRDTEVKGLMAEVRRKEEQFGLIMDGYTARIQKARTGAEAAALTREAETRKAEMERELAVLRRQVQETTGRPVAPAPVPSRAAVPRPENAQPVPPPPAPATVAPPEPAGDEPGLVPSSKTDIAQLDPAERKKFEEAPNGRPDAGQPLAAAAPAAPNSRISKLVLPTIAQDLLNRHDGTRIKVKVLLDEFGQPTRIIPENCPAELEGPITASVRQTRFVGTRLNGRPVKGSIELTYQIAMGGVSAR